jgi:hypothetical protein
VPPRDEEDLDGEEYKELSVFLHIFAYMYDY